MSRIFVAFVINLACGLLLSSTLIPQEKKRIVILENPIGKAGTVSLTLRTDKTYQNGNGEKNFGIDDSIPIDIGTRKGDLLYESKLNNAKSVKDWVLEGLGDIFFENGQMIMRSKTLKPEITGTEHFNFRCPVDFPESFIAEWEFKAIQEYGISLIFFAALGKNGEDIFDPTLPKRDGRYILQYANGAINNYHILYFANHAMSGNSRMYSILYKNQYLVKPGFIAVAPEAKGFRHMCLIKDGAHIQLLANGKVYVDFTDPGTERWGPVYGSGKISFRQMSYTVGAYRNFKVWELN